jgi:hypothetical protein
MDRDLSHDDKRHLADLQKKMQVVRDRVGGVVAGFHTGVVITGRGGVGKSHVVEDELKQRKANRQLWNSHMTGRCLFDRLEQYPDAIHLIEDAEDLFGDKAAQGVLRSALWAGQEQKRFVTWNAHGHAREFVFTGGLILIANRRLSELPEVQALKTRISVVNLTVSDNEVAALMRHVSLQGYQRGVHRLDVDECQEVAELVIEESRRLNRSLDMRLLVNSFTDRLQVDDHEAGCCWQDLVRDRIRESATAAGDIEPVGIRTQKKAAELQVARDIVAMEPAQRLEIWGQRTGKSQATLYRRLSELGRNDAVDFEV